MKRIRQTLTPAQADQQRQLARNLEAGDRQQVAQAVRQLRARILALHASTIFNRGYTNMADQAGSESGMLVSEHDGYRIRYVPVSTNDGAVDRLRFEDERGMLKLTVYMPEGVESLRRWHELLARASSGQAVSGAKDIGFGRRLLLRIMGRSIVFAQEFSARIERQQSATAELVFSTRYVFALLRGWFNPGALILVTNIRRQIPTSFLAKGKWSGDFRKWRLTLEDCRRLEVGLDRVIHALG